MYNENFDIEFTQSVENKQLKKILFINFTKVGTNWTLFDFSIVLKTNNLHIPGEQICRKPTIFYVSSAISLAIISNLSVGIMSIVPSPKSLTIHDRQGTIISSCPIIGLMS